MNEERIIKIGQPVECTIQERLNKFVVKVLLDRKPQKAYISNTGRLLGYLVEGRTGFCIRPLKKGKTDCRLFAVKDDRFAAIIDTQLQMKAFEKALDMTLIPWLGKSRMLRRNVRLGESLIDYLLECDGKAVYLEVKSAVSMDNKYAMYPDCPSSRGRRHIRELTDHVKAEGRGILLFIAALPGAKAFKPDRHADPELHMLLTEARQAGVELRSIRLHYNPKDSFIYLADPDLEVNVSQHRRIGRQVSG